MIPFIQNTCLIFAFILTFGFPVKADDRNIIPEEKETNPGQALEIVPAQPIPAATLIFTYDSAGNRTQQQYMVQMNPGISLIYPRLKDLGSFREIVASVITSAPVSNGQEIEKEVRDDS